MSEGVMKVSTRGSGTHFSLFPSGTWRSALKHDEEDDVRVDVIIVASDVAVSLERHGSMSFSSVEEFYEWCCDLPTTIKAMTPCKVETTEQEARNLLLHHKCRISTLEERDVLSHDEQAMLIGYRQMVDGLEP